MNEHRTPALSGVLKVVFFLAVASTAITAVTIGVTTLYEAPSGDQSEFREFGAFDDVVFEQDEETADYNRNLGLIFGFIGIGAIALGILGLGSRSNPLRAGMVAGGVGLVFGGVVAGSSGSDDWLTFLTSGLAFLALVACSPWLDDGLPLGALSGGTSDDAPGGPPAAGPGGGPGGGGGQRPD
jgi:hypothetical protein